MIRQRDRGRGMLMIIRSTHILAITCPANFGGNTRARTPKKWPVDLRTKLESMLQPSTPQKRLDQLRRIIPVGQKAFLRLRQKETQKEEWLLNPDTGDVHKGAHFPLLMFTNNSSARSKESDDKRKANLNARGIWCKDASAKGEPARLQHRAIAPPMQAIMNPVRIVEIDEAAPAVAETPAVADTYRDAAPVHEVEPAVAAWSGSGWDGWHSGRDGWDSGWSHNEWQDSGRDGWDSGWSHNEWQDSGWGGWDSGWSHNELQDSGWGGWDSGWP